MFSKKPTNNKKTVRPERYLEHAKNQKRFHVVYDRDTFQRTTKFCILFGHTIEETAGESFFYLSGRIRKYYRGSCSMCVRKGCTYQNFTGSKTPWKITKEIDGIEHDITARRQPPAVGVPVQQPLGGESPVNTGQPVAGEPEKLGIATGPGYGEDASTDIPMGTGCAGDNELGERDGGC